MTITNRNRILTMLAVAIIMLAACGKEKSVAIPQPGNEALTTMVLRLVNTTDPADTPTARWQQLDPTGAAPADTSGAVLHLRNNAAYSVQVQFLDTLTDLTPEIKDRQNYHLICFDATAGLQLTLQRTDHDSNTPPLEVGLTALLTTTAASSGQLAVTLHHQPNVKNGDCARGSTDMACTFSVNIIN